MPETNKVCEVKDCERPYSGRGYCAKHYQAWRRHGDPTVVKFVRGNDDARFALHVCPETTGCLIWTGALDEDGYGKFRAGVSQGQRMQPAHVWGWERINGPVPDGLVLDHYVCERPSCVNPDHVRPTTNRENILRGTGLASGNLAKTHCPQGHAYSEKNTLRSGGRRICRTCKQRREQARRTA